MPTSYTTVFGTRPAGPHHVILTGWHVVDPQGRSIGVYRSKRWADLEATAVSAGLVFGRHLSLHRS